MAAVLSPLAGLGAFLCFARGYFVGALVLLIAALTMTAAFPITQRIPCFPKASSGKLRDIATTTSTALVMIWLFSSPELTAFLDSVFEQHSLWDWRIISAALVWTSYSIHSNLNIVRTCTENTIVNFYTAN